MIESVSPENETIRHRSLSQLLAAVCSASLLAVGCQWYAWEPKEKEIPLNFEPAAIPLAPGSTLSQQLNCPDGNCQTRFRVEVDRPGDLRIEVRPQQVNPETSLGVVLEDPIGRVLARQSLDGRKPPLRVSSPVQKGPHIALVQAIGGAVSFEISARFRAGGEAAQPWAEPPPAPAESRLPAPHQPRAGSAPTAVYDPKINFHTFRRYAFASEPKSDVQAHSSGTTNAFMDQKIQRVARTELTHRGFTESSVAEADFLLSAHIGSRSTTWYSVRGVAHQDPYDRYFDMWRGRSGRIVPHTYTDKTVVMDFIDPKTGQLLWHGWTTEAAAPSTDNTEVLRKAVQKILDKFPPE